MQNNKLYLPVALLVVLAAKLTPTLAAEPVVTEFAAIGAVQELVLPSCVAVIDYYIAGSSGGPARVLDPLITPAVSGFGSTTMEKELFVGFGSKICVFVGDYTGFNGGADGGAFGAEGGGATDIRVCPDCSVPECDFSTRVAVAGGGGGAGFNFVSAADLCPGANGGFPAGEDALECVDVAVGGGGNGGTQTAGGLGYPGSSSSEDGVFGLGGLANPVFGGGGGGGYYGGGGGAQLGGGGGSSWSAGGSAMYGVLNTAMSGFAVVNYTLCTPTQSPSAEPTHSQAPTASPTTEPSLGESAAPTVSPTHGAGNLGCGCVPSLAGKCFYTPDSRRTQRAYYSCFSNATVSGVNQINVRNGATTFIGELTDCDYQGYGTFVTPEATGGYCGAIAGPRIAYTKVECDIGQPRGGVTDEPVDDTCRYYTTITGDEFCNEPLLTQCRGETPAPSAEPSTAPTAAPSVLPTVVPTAIPTVDTGPDAFSGCVTSLEGRCFTTSDSTNPFVQYTTCFDGGATTGISRTVIAPTVSSSSLGSISVFDYVGEGLFQQPPLSSTACPAGGASEQHDYSIEFACNEFLPTPAGFTAFTSPCSYKTTILGAEFCTCDEAVPCEGISDWSFLEGKCFNSQGADTGTDGGQYQYELCFDTGAGVTQDRIDGKPFVTSAGTLTHKDYLGDCQFPHYNGNPCPILNGGSRSGIVTFSCNPTETVISTIEETKCFYKTNIATPAFCGQAAADAAFRV